MITSTRRSLTYLFLLCMAVMVTACGNSADENVTIDDAYPVTGTVTDEAGQPLMGASILIANTTVGTITDQAGKFELSVSGDDVDLQVRYTGYLAETVAVDNALGGSVNVEMKKE